MSLGDHQRGALVQWMSIGEWAESGLNVLRRSARTGEFVEASTVATPFVEVPMKMLDA